MIGETQPEIELLEVVTFIYPFSIKTGSSIPSASRILVFNTVPLDFIFLKEDLVSAEIGFNFFTTTTCFIQKKRSKTGGFLIALLHKNAK